MVGTKQPKIMEYVKTDTKEPNTPITPDVAQEILTPVTPPEPDGEINQAAIPGTEEAPTLSDADFLKHYNRQMGFEGEKAITSMDQLKPPAPEPSEEEKKKAQTSQDMTLLQRFVAKGHTPQEFTLLQQIANSDIKEFSLAEAKRELINAGFNADEVDDEIKARYYQLSEDEKENLSENDKELLKKHEYFTNKLANKSAYKIEQAKGVFSALQAEIDAENYEKQVDAKLSSTVEEIAKKMDRKIVLDMGVSNGQQLNPVEYIIEDADILDIQSTLSDKAKREQFLYNQDGSENVENLFDALKWKKIALSLAKKSLLQGATEQVDFFNTKFPTNPYSVAPGHVRTGKTGEVGKAIPGTEKIKFRTTA